MSRAPLTTPTSLLLTACVVAVGSGTLSGGAVVTSDVSGSGAIVGE